MNKRYIMSMASICIIMTACSENVLNEHENGWKGNEPLQLSASISETVLGRAEEDFTAGKYYFSYVNNTQTSLRYTDKETEFDGSGTGISYLTWDKVNTNSNLKNKLFILDNVPFQIVNDKIKYFTSGTDGNINLGDIKEGDKPKYTAAPAPEIPGTGNDLLWGTVKVADQIPLSPVHFELEHRMSMLTFELYSKDDEIKELLKEDVTVKLEDVITEPTTFNRVTGNVSVSYTGRNVTSDIDNMEVLPPTEEDGGVSRYTKSWIFPPQQFHNIGRPILNVTLSKTEGEGTETITKTKTFRGRLPESMIYNNNNKSELLEFISGCHLIIEVKLGNWNDMEIRFRPVLVRKWIPQTLVDINVDQVGIRTAEELSDLVSTYNNNPNDSKLWKYGVLKDETWYFDLWKNIDSYEKPEGSSDNTDLGFNEGENPGFKIISHGYKINGKTVNENGTLSDKTETNQ